MTNQGQQPFSWSWTFASVLIFTAMEIAIAVFLAPAIFAGYLASPMLQMRLQTLMHLASFWAGGVAVGIISPRLRLMEPAVGAFFAVMVTFMMSFFMPTHWMRFDVNKLVVGGGIAFALALAGAWTGERIMGNVAADDDVRARVRDRMWGERGVLSRGDSRLVVQKPSRRART